MTFTPIFAFAIVAAAFAFGDFIALKTKGVVSTFITAIFIFVLFGGVLKLLPPNLVELSGLTALIPTFGMALILTNLGSSLDLNELVKEWKTILISLAGIVGIVLICFTIGQMIFGRETALSAIAPIAGGIVSTMITSEVANSVGRTDIAAFVACITAIQMLVGLPIASFCLRKSAKKYIQQGRLDTLDVAQNKKINLQLFKGTPKGMDFATTHFARLALVAAAAQVLASFTGLNATICYLIMGALASATGILEKNSLKKAGGDGIMLLATYAYVTVNFVSMSFSEFAAILVPVISMLLLGAVGIMIFAPIVGKLLGWDIYLSIATAISCMFGYPVTYAVAMEVVAGAQQEQSLSATQVQKLTDHLLPKMIIAGVTSVSVASVVIAGIIAPMIFI